MVHDADTFTCPVPAKPEHPAARFIRLYLYAYTADEAAADYVV